MEENREKIANIKIKSKKDSDVKGEESCRVFVNKEADVAIDVFLNDINVDFAAGKANRLDAASFMINWFRSNAPNDVIFEIRRQLANSVSMLDAVYKKARSGEDLPPEIKLALEKHFFGADAQLNKKVKKPLKQEYINDKLQESEII